MATERIMPAVAQIVAENLHDENFNVQVLSQKIFLSRSQLFRRMKKEAALTPSQYIGEMRLLRAYDLLSREKEYSISQISDLCGFRDLAYFSKAVKLRFGASPMNIKILQKSK